MVGRSIAAALAGSAIAAVPASAFVLEDPAPGRNISVFHNLDFVAVFGYPADGTPVQVDVMRGVHRIGTVSAPAVVTADGPGLEINHGVDAPPAGPGDCFTGHTPDIRPGDEIVVRSGTAPVDVDRIAVDHITIDGDPVLMPNGDIHVHGMAERANANRDPIPVAELDSAEWRLGGYRGAPNDVIATPGTRSGWTAIIRPPYNGRPDAARNQSNLDEAGRKEALLTRIHTMGYGHVVVPPAETQLFEGEEAPGPAAGCESTAPGRRNAVTGTDDEVVGPTSANLQVNGTAMGQVLGATDADPAKPVVGAVVTLDDQDAATAPVTKPVSLPGGTAQQAWTTSFTPAEMATLKDGEISVSAAYTVDAPGDLTGPGLKIVKDTTSPNVVPDVAPGDHAAPKSVALSAGPGETIHYRTDGVAADQNSPTYTGPIALGAGTTVITWWARDPAGNISSGSLEYTLTAAAGSPSPTGGSAGAGTGSAAAGAAALVPVGPAALLPARAVAGIRMTGRLRLSAARRLGVSVSFLAPRGARVAVVRLIERRDGVRRRLATRTLPVRGGKRSVVSFRDASVRRRLAAGRYEVEIRSGPSPAKLGPRSTRTVQLAP